jgi:hypothetical protein
MSSRSVSLSSTFLLLAAGGSAACDNSRDYHREGFYCADANGVVVDEDLCDANRHYGGGLVPYYIWHAPFYGGGYPVGFRLPSGGNRFAYNDQASRSTFGLPKTGRIGNGTVKTNVVGKGGGGTSTGSNSGTHSSVKSGG